MTQKFFCFNGRDQFLWNYSFGEKIEQKRCFGGKTFHRVFFRWKLSLRLKFEKNCHRITEAPLGILTLGTAAMLNNCLCDDLHYFAFALICGVIEGVAGHSLIILTVWENRCWLTINWRNTRLSFSETRSKKQQKTGCFVDVQKFYFTLKFWLLVSSKQ